MYIKVSDVMFNGDAHGDVSPYVYVDENASIHHDGEYDMHGALVSRHTQYLRPLPRIVLLLLQKMS